MGTIDIDAIVALVTDPDTVDMDVVRPTAREFAALADPQPVLRQLNAELARLGVGGYTAELVTEPELLSDLEPPEGCTHVLFVRPVQASRFQSVVSFMEVLSDTTFWGFHPESGAHQLFSRAAAQERAAEDSPDDDEDQEAYAALLAEMPATVLQLNRLIAVLEPDCQTDLQLKLLEMAKAHLDPTAVEMLAELAEGQEPSPLDALMPLAIAEQVLRTLVADLGLNYGPVLERARRS